MAGRRASVAGRRMGAAVGVAGRRIGAVRRGVGHG